MIRGARRGDTLPRSRTTAQFGHILTTNRDTVRFGTRHYLSYIAAGLVGDAQLALHLAVS